MTAVVRPERAVDHSAVHERNVAAFGGAVEARLVDMLREQARPLVSLVADEDGAVVGHIMFSPVSLPGYESLMMGLAPMAVALSRQRQGIGSALVGAGLPRVRELGAVAVVVLGHPDFYPRFGFVPAATFGLQCEYDVPTEAFMALELERNALHGITGKISYHPAFRNL